MSEMSTVSYLDYSMLHELLHFLETGCEYSWARDCVLPATSVMLSSDNAHIAPGMMNTNNTVVDDIEFLKGELQRATLLRPLPRNFVSGDHYIEAREYTKNAVANADRLATISQSAEAVVGSTEFKTWMEWDLHVEHGLKGYIRRNEGLFPKEHIPLVAEALDVSVADAGQLHSASGNFNHVKALSGRDYLAYFHAYMVSGLVRGLVNDKNAELQGAQIYHSPFRKALFENEEDKKTVENACPNTEYFLMRDLLHGALKQRGLRNRIKCYVENVRKARGYLNNLPDRVVPVDDAEAAEKQAREIAIAANLTLWPKRNELLFSVAIGAIGASAIGSLGLSIWGSVIASGIFSGLIHKSQLPVAWAQNQRAMSKLPAGRLFYDYTE